MRFLKFYIGLLLIVFNLYAFRSVAQSNQSFNDTINQFNEGGEKHGWWVVYLTKKFRSVKKEKNAAFYWYKRYFYGKPFDIEVGLMASFEKTSTSLDSLLPGKEKPILLNGTVLIYRKYKKRRIIFMEYIFFDGVLLKMSGYNLKGSISSTLDFNEKYKKYNGKEFSYHVKIFNDYGKFASEYFVVIDDSKMITFDGNDKVMKWHKIK
jgi:hypothetical protein